MLWPDITPESRFVWDESASFTDTTIFQSTGASPADAALMNSSIAEFLLFQLCPTIRGGFLRLKIQYLETFPIPTMDEQVRSELALIARSAAPDTATLRVDALVASAYRLSQTEQTLIRRWTADRKTIVADELETQERTDEDDSVA